MNRLTKDDVKEMGMVDLAHNQVFIKDGEAWYRDFGREISIRDLAKEMFNFHNIKYSQNLDEFDEDMMYLLEDDYQTIEGVIALFYRSLWAFADIRETLKAYEDTGLEPEEIQDNLTDCFNAQFKVLEYINLEHKGLLIKLPCKVGKTIYIVGSKYRKGTLEKWVNTGKFKLSDIEKLGKTVFLTREEAEKALDLSRVNKPLENMYFNNLKEISRASDIIKQGHLQDL